MECQTPSPRETPEELLRQLLACLEREEEALRQAEEAEIWAAAREKEKILSRVAAWQSQTGISGREEAALAIPADLKRRVAFQAARNRALLQAALEAIQDFLHLLTPSGPGVYEPEGRLKPGGSGGLVRRQA